MTADSYLMLLRDKNDNWMARGALTFNGDLTPVEHTASEPLKAITAVVKWMEKSKKNCESHPDYIPMISHDGICLNAFLRKAHLLDLGWGICLFGSAQAERWFAVVGHDEHLLLSGGFAGAMADADAALAVGGLEVEFAQSRIEYKREMVHSVNPRDEDGNLIRHNTDRNKRRRIKQQEMASPRKAWGKTEEASQWRSLVTSQPRYIPNKNND